MAEKSEVNKSAAIRKAYEENPKLSVSETVAALADKGIEVKKTLVYLVRKQMKAKQRKRARVGRAVAAAGNNGAAGTVTLDVLATIKKVRVLASEVGGMNKLKALIEALS